MLREDALTLLAEITGRCPPEPLLPASGPPEVPGPPEEAEYPFGRPALMPHEVAWGLVPNRIRGAESVGAELYRFARVP